MLYTNIPVELVGAINEPVQGIARAPRERNEEAFQASYAGLLSDCNSCHAAAGVGFIRIQTPTAFPFNDQALSPQGRN